MQPQQDEMPHIVKIYQASLCSCVGDAIIDDMEDLKKLSEQYGNNNLILHFEDGKLSGITIYDDYVE